MRIDKCVSDLIVSPTLKINERCLALIQSGQKVIKFGFGQSPFPIPKLLVEGLQENAYRKNYENVQGLLELRKAIQMYYQKRNLAFEVENIFVGAGTKPLISLMQQVLDYPLILPTPSWVSYKPQANLFDKTIFNIDCTNNTNKLLRADLLEACCAQHHITGALLILNYPSNPVGTTLDQDELEQIASVARKYEIIILSDEIYGDLHFEDKHDSIATYYPEGTIITNGISKWCGAGGWRLGAAMIPKAMASLSQALLPVISETYSCVSTPIQYASIPAFQEPENLLQYKSDGRFLLKKISDFVYYTLLPFDPDLSKPVGGFYCFPSLNAYKESLNKKGIYNAEQLCDAILNETGVALLPSTAFGVEDQLSFRLSFVDFDGGNALQQLEKYRDATEEEVTKQLAPNVYLGMHKLITWIKTI